MRKATAAGARASCKAGRGANVLRAACLRMTTAAALCAGSLAAGGSASAQDPSPGEAPAPSVPAEPGSAKAEPAKTLPTTAGPAQDDTTAERVEKRTQEIQERASASVVEMRITVSQVRLPKIQLPGLVLSPFRARNPERVEATAFFVTRDGHIVTTSDAARSGSVFEVRFADGTLRDATLVGLDEPFRLAVLRTAAPGNANALFDAGDLEPGRRALGWLLGAPEAPGQAPVQITSVRAAMRSDGAYDRYLTSSMSLLPGAAGSPLLSEQGTLLGMAVGMTSAAAGDDAAKGAVLRSALFVRGEDILRAVEQIAKTGHVKRARLGLMLDGATNRVDQILPGGPAEMAGLREGDLVTNVAGVPVATAAEISRLLLRRKPGETIEIGVHRGAADVAREIVLEDVSMPPLPTTPPIDGVVLEMAMAWPQSIEGRSAVSFIEIEKDSAAARAGVRVGDSLVSVDGMDARRYLSRHRIRAAGQQPAVFVIDREGEQRTITLPR